MMLDNKLQLKLAKAIRIREFYKLTPKEKAKLNKFIRITTYKLKKQYGGDVYA